ncbi:Glycosyltransferase family 25 (LPS biosynthesis protein) [[Luteovulum] sphaeroides subsp. megalophilum]|uniref:family 16 glycosylhydrolase n=1 Tax=Cereibacter sphaeroides TaxID=1063 RepID=UPI000B674F85|nr:family 16 glycosylhydrolase [Cereibacter sphaeroides]SNS12466.1 Glycosyltransferase family 25 (LPS biosynthesis protein) [[Luteovulum] sphaeroides subsp. megalophilum]
MNLQRVSGLFRSLTFRASRAVAAILPGGRISSFGAGSDKIGSILILNLDRQPARWRRVLRELDRFQTSDGDPLTSIATRLAAVDARDGRAVAATADVDPNYRLGDQLYVQPDPLLEACFSADEPVRMTRQEVAVARSHIEAWKVIASGEHKHVLILEDDVWFTPRAALAIECGWLAALERCHAEGGPRLLYLSYEEADETAERAEPCDYLFRPTRGLWFLSGYVLSREGAAALLRAMPVKGPVDMWMNYRFQELGALALSSPAILQRRDCASDNSYSILPYLARAGVVNTSSGPLPPERTRAGPVLAWTARGDREDLAMALSMLGLRVRVFDGDEKSLSAEDFVDLTVQFDALIDAPLMSTAYTTVIGMPSVKFVLEPGAANQFGLDPASLPPSRTTILVFEGPDDRKWKPICALLDLPPPSEAFPVGTLRSERMFRDDRKGDDHALGEFGPIEKAHLDDSPWVLPQTSGWQPRFPNQRRSGFAGELLVCESMKMATPSFLSLAETFPGNLASFAKEGLTRDDEGTHITMEKAPLSERPYRSGAFASAHSFRYGRFEAEIKAAAGPGIVTGFFLYRSGPRQEIDVELAGNDPRILLANVYFNPGDEGTAMTYGYRGAPSRIDLGFDATQDFHRYSIDWRPGLITWSVDGKTVHERVGWDPTPIPHLPMALYGNLWAPRSEDLAGRINEKFTSARAVFRNVSVFA